jgi:hypothetical protein
MTILGKLAVSAIFAPSGSIFRLRSELMAASESVPVAYIDVILGVDIEGWGGDTHLIHIHIDIPTHNH